MIASWKKTYLEGDAEALGKGKGRPPMPDKTKIQKNERKRNEK